MWTLSIYLCVKSLILCSILGTWLLALTFRTTTNGIWSISSVGNFTVGPFTLRQGTFQLQRGEWLLLPYYPTTCKRFSLREVTDQFILSSVCPGYAFDYSRFLSPDAVSFGPVSPSKTRPCNRSGKPWEYSRAIGQCHRNGNDHEKEKVVQSRHVGSGPIPSDDRFVWAVWPHGNHDLRSYIFQRNNLLLWKRSAPLAHILRNSVRLMARLFLFLWFCKLAYFVRAILPLSSAPIALTHRIDRNRSNLIALITWHMTEFLSRMTRGWQVPCWEHFLFKQALGCVFMTR